MSSLRTLTFNSVVRSLERKKWIYSLFWVVLGIWLLKNFFPHPFHSNSSSGSSSSSSNVALSTKDNIFGDRTRITPTSTSTKDASHTALPDFYKLITQQSTQSVDYGTVTNPKVTANVSTSSKVAVIMETRRSAVLIPLILAFSAVLGPDWPIVIYTDSENFGSFATSHALTRHQKAGRIVVRPLAEGLFFPNWDSVSDFLTTPWLWEQLAPAEHVLLFQADSILCANSPRSVEDFFDYDLVGAPIAPSLGAGFNGGLSLRKRSTMLKVLDEFEWAKDPNPRPEDQWYFARMKDLQDREAEDGVPEEEWSIKLPSMEMARSFAVETIDYPSPLGLHQPTRFLQDHMRSLDEYCPEYKLASAPRINE